jgi:hypothetical protein
VASIKTWNISRFTHLAIPRLDFANHVSDLRILIAVQASYVLGATKYEVLINFMRTEITLITRRSTVKTAQTVTSVFERKESISLKASHNVYYTKRLV